MAIIFPMPGSDTKNLTEVEKWKIYAEVCKWTDQKTGKIVNNGIERIIEGVKVENIKVKERTRARETGSSVDLELSRDLYNKVRRTLRL